MSGSNWRRVSRGEPCPICQRPDWCLVVGPEGSPEAVICPRVESQQRAGEGGWLHILRDSSRPAARSISIAMDDGPGADFVKLATDYQRAIRAEPYRLARLAHSLELSIASLQRLGVGWSARHRAYTFPLRRGDGTICGLRLRSPAGRKWAVRGSRQGIFIPADLDATGRLLIAEGPTDTATCLDWGLSAIGRPSCSGGTRDAVAYVRQHRPAGVVVMADADEPGRRGAEALAGVLVANTAACRVIAPPPETKDARAWRRSGASAKDVLAAIDAAPLRQLEITTRRTTL